MTSFFRVRGGSNHREPKLQLLLLILTLVIAAVFLSSCGHSGRNISHTSPPLRSKNNPIAVPEEKPSPTTTPEEQPQKPPQTVPKAPESTNRVGQESVPGKLPPGDTELSHGPSGSEKIALTFDAGASSKPTPGLLAVLAEKGVHATFFLTGKWVEENPELTKQIIAAGHEIGNHTYSHRDLRTLSDDEIREELSKTEDLVQTTAGASTKPYFRPPYGARDNRVLRIAADAGYRCVYWTDDSWDGFKKGIKADEIEDRVLRKAKDGTIVLMHCGSYPTVDALPHIIDELRARGYDLVKVSDLQ